MSLDRSPWGVAKKSLSWAVSLCALQQNDILFPAFPRVGGTWVRIVAWHLYHLRTFGQLPAFTFDQLDREMPEMGRRESWASWSFAPLPRLMKTHKPYMSPYRDRRAVLVTRDPRTTMKSLLAYTAGAKSYSYDGTLDDLIEDPQLGLAAYMKFHASWQPHASLILKYEDLRADPEACFRELFEVIGVDHTPSELKDVLDAASMENVRRGQAGSSQSFKEQFTNNFAFARSGDTVPEADVFSAHAESLYRDLRERYAFDLYDAS